MSGLLLVLCFQNVKASNLVLWYDHPATGRPLNEGLPIGNGRMGCLIMGGAERENLVLSESSLWTGNGNPSGKYETMGAFQMLGNLYINLPSHGACTNYRRDLDIGKSLAHISYESGGIKFEREYFCSASAEGLVVRLKASHPGQYTGHIVFKDAHGAQTAADKSRLVCSGTLNNGLCYETQAAVIAKGGTVRTENGTVFFDKCDSIYLIIGAGTNYIMDPDKNFCGEPPHARVSQMVTQTASSSYEKLKADHEQDYKALFDRVTLNVGVSSPQQVALPMNKRKEEATKVADPELEALLFQYGRYLMISSSRPGGLPANLQGLWNDTNNPAWHSDYHTNINIEMNYWLAEPTNLSECHLPLFALVNSQLSSWRKFTQEDTEWKTNTGITCQRGFALRTSHGIFGDMGWRWDKTANAWYAQHYWEHYAFTHDTTFLKKTAYPFLKEVCEFWEDHLKTRADGKLVVPHAWSPEHGPSMDGVSYCQEIIWDLFTNYIEAADALGVDRAYRTKVAEMRDKLLTPGIGSWGQLLEWPEELKGQGDLDTSGDHHRHTSHLFGIFPGRQINSLTTPDLLKAGKVSLDARGSGGDCREWSFAWRTALYARMEDGDSAHQMLQQMFASRNTCPNLFGFHPPMQIDGNFGITAGIAEMLLQSHNGEIHLLPALPPQWPEGSSKGLRARGNVEVDLSWNGGKLAEAVLRTPVAQKRVIHYEGKKIDANLIPGIPFVIHQQY